MEREGRGENFVNRKRLNFVGRSVAAISIAAAGGAAVEKFGSFDPLTNPVESANHLVLNNLYESYKQLIDRLPEVGKAEAAAVTSTCTMTAATVGTCNNPIADGDHIAIVFTGILLDDTCHANVQHGGVGEGGSFDVRVVVDTMNVRCDEFGALPVDATICCADAPPPPPPEPTPIKGVGGIAELPEISNSPQNMNSEKSTDYTLPIAAGVAVALAATAAGVLYNRRNRSAR